MIRSIAPLYAVLGWFAATGGALGAIAIRIADPVPQLPSTFGFGDAALVGFGVLGIAFATVGGLLTVKRPSNVIGWLMVVIGVGYAVGVFWAAVTFSLAADSSKADWLDVRLAAWLTVLFTSLGGAVFVIGFVFPTGRGQTPAWDRALKIAAILAPFMFITVFLIRPGPLHVFQDIENPFGFGPDFRPWLGDDVSARLASMSVVILPVVIWSLASRYRQAGLVERQQLKWFALATGVTIGTLAIATIGALLTDDPPELGLALFGFVGALIPVAIGIAILRHGLYDIDRLISRTLGYGVITVVLAAVFAASVFGLSVLLGTLADGNSLAVALSTLIVAALFGPLRRRAQAAIDRRFDRAEYDTARIATEFSDRLRDEVDLATLTTDLAATASTTLSPTKLGIWIREPSR